MKLKTVKMLGMVVYISLVSLFLCLVMVLVPSPSGRVVMLIYMVAYITLTSPVIWRIIIRKAVIEKEIDPLDYDDEDD